MTSNISDDESGQVKHAANMLMEAVQNFVRAGVPTGAFSSASSTGRHSGRTRRRRKGLRIHGSCSDEEPGPSGVSLVPQQTSVAITHTDHSSPRKRGNSLHCTTRSTAQNYRDDGIVTQQTQRDQFRQSQATAQSQRQYVQSGAHVVSNLTVTEPATAASLAEPQGQRIRELTYYNQSNRCSGVVPSCTNTVMQPVQRPSCRDLIVQKPVAAMNQSVLAEHSKLFKFNPSKQYTKKAYCGKGKGKGSGNALDRPKNSSTFWKKNCFCLSHCKQELKPTPEEKIHLAKIGLEMKCLLFDLEGNAHHVHSVIIKEWPVLENCGGYTLLRLAENSHSLVEIEPPLSGHINVQFLKAILNNATMYIRPLQCNIFYEDMKQFCSLQVCKY